MRGQRFQPADAGLLIGLGIRRGGRQHDHQPIAVQRSHGHQPEALGVLAQPAEVLVVRHRPDRNHHRRLRVPAQRGRPRQQVFVRVGPHHRVHDERLDPLVPAAPGFGRSRVDLGRSERDLSRIVQDGGLQHGTVTSRHQLTDLRLHHIDRGAYQIDRLVQVDLASEGTRRDVEDPSRVEIGLGIVGEPVDESVDALVGDHAHPGTLLGAQIRIPGVADLHLRDDRRAHPAGLGGQSLGNGGAGAGGRYERPAGTRRGFHGH
ncbi:hypothetical protein SDC9_87687 [bioreactor metagenome]|uniref:Uncharacterized protein n=1 Tax=bioreactor metagenome TaxID=1076179 RepID=A0A644ZL17_9ZZZZ